MRNDGQSRGTETDAALVEALFDKVLTISPNSAAAHLKLGKTMQRLSLPKKALAYLQRAVSLNAECAETRNQLGEVLAELNMEEPAIREFEAALKIQPDFAQAYYNLALSLEALGQLDEARHALEQAITLAPRKATYYQHLGKLTRFVADSPYLTIMETLAEEMTSLSGPEQIALNFALAKAYLDLDLHQRSFHYLLEGNRLKREEEGYDEAVTLSTLRQCRTVFSAGFMDEFRGAGNPSPTPVFIVGMPRSGTTLVEQILSSHSKVFGAGELATFGAAVMSLAAMDGVMPPYPALVPAFSREHFRVLGSRYLKWVTARGPQAERIIDKMPGNFMFAGLIHLALPNARIIHVRRDPIDTCVSCFSSLFGQGQKFSYDLAELGRYYRAYEGLMEYWRTVLPEGVMIEVRYEDVVADIKRQAQRIISFCGLDWEDACLDFHRTERPVRTTSAVQVRSPIYATSVGRWKPHGEHLRPLLDALAGVSELPCTMTVSDADRLTSDIIRQAIAMQGKGRLSEAERLYRTALEIEPTNFDSLYNLASIHLHQGQPPKAVNILLKTVELFPESAEARCSLGTALLSANRVEEAVAQFRAALQIRSNDAVALQGFGNALAALCRGA